MTYRNFQKNYREDPCISFNCKGVPFPEPTQIPIRPPIQLRPTLLDMYSCIGKWTYFWTANGNGWLYVMHIGIGFDPQFQHFREAIWGCNSLNSKCMDLPLPLDDITNYKIL